MQWCSSRGGPASSASTGFLKQLIEKLFRATKISKLYILLRTKQGKPIEQRLSEMLQDPVYDFVKEQQPNFADKIVPVAGDVAELELGLNDKDWKMLTEQVDIIFHMAATTRFDEKLRISTLINVRGAREALLLGKACKKLRSYVHVSTAYSYACENMIDTEVAEDFYKSPVDPEALIKLAETVKEDRLNNMTSSLIKNWPNTYSFAKSVAEETVRSLSDDMPLCIVRPAIVAVAMKEPSPGWVDISNVYGASGMILGTGLGVMHTVLADDKTRVDVIPVDYVNNAILTAAWKTAKNKNAGEIKTKIYTVTSSRNGFLCGYIRSTLKECYDIYGTPMAVGFPFIWQTNNHMLFWLYSWFLHFIPAYVIDGVCLVLGKEKRFVKLYTKMYNMSKVLSYFTLNHWKFIDKNTESLYESLSPVDREIFDFDVNKIDWKEYMILWCLGLRKYIVKDGLVGLKYALRKYFILRILTYIIAPVYVYCLYRLLCLGIFVLSASFSIFW